MAARRKDHHRNYARSDPAAARRRLVAKVEVVTETGCWIWMGATSTNKIGELYGQFRLHGKRIGSHRAAVILFHPGRKRIYPGMVVAHQCNTTLCCNPKHLKVESQSTNMKYWHATTWQGGQGDPGEQETTQPACTHCYDVGCDRCDGVPF